MGGTDWRRVPIIARKIVSSVLGYIFILSFLFTHSRMISVLFVGIAVVFLR
jgi:hypothetical protein